MPVITVSASDLKSLIGKDVANSQLEAVLPLVKCEIEEWNDDEMKIEVTPDRPDLFSTEGIARQVASWLGFRRGLHGYMVSKPTIQMKSEPVKARPEIVAGMVRGVEMSEGMVRSIMQLQEAIDLTIGRDRTKSAIGIHDASNVKPPFFYREVGGKDIEFVPLGKTKKMNIDQILKDHPKGVQYKHIFKGVKTYPIIVDKNDDVLSFPPIINGELTKVTPETKDIFLDITGFDQTPLNYALNILLGALEMRGGRIEGVKLDNRTYPHLKARPVRLDKDAVRAMLGVNLKDRDIKDCLERMGYGVDIKASLVSVPPYRADIMHHVDIIEDVAIAYGFNDFVPEVPKLPVIGKSNPVDDFVLSLKELMVGIGFSEVINYSLTNDERQFTRMGLKDPGAVQISNPVSGEYSSLRYWVLPSLLENLGSNIHRRYPQKLFELNDCVHKDKRQETGTRNLKRLACVVSHGSAGFSELMSYYHAFVLGLPIKLHLKEKDHPSFIPGRCAAIYRGKREIGVLGEIHPETIGNYHLKMPVTALELDIQTIWEAYAKKKR